MYINSVVIYIHMYYNITEVNNTLFKGVNVVARHNTNSLQCILLREI